jgi:uncharacterized membrane protein YfcA
MLKLFIIGIIIFILAVVMTMSGRGGENYYVVTLVMAGFPMHQAATTGQFMAVTATLSALLIFQKHHMVVWPLVCFFGPFTALSAFGGGYIAFWFNDFALKIIFSCMLALTGLFMFFPAPDAADEHPGRRLGVWQRHSGGMNYTVNLWVTVPTILLSGCGSGMVGVSAGSFLIPLMVLSCRVPMHLAIGTSSILIAATAGMGFTGHALRGDFDPTWVIPLAVVTMAGGMLGAKFALRTNPQSLKLLFAYTELAAAALIVINAFYSHHS